MHKNRFRKRDRQEEPPAAVCDLCACEIYRGEEAYFIGGYAVCTECLRDFAEEYFAGDLMPAGSAYRGKV